MRALCQPCRVYTLSVTHKEHKSVTVQLPFKRTLCVVYVSTRAHKHTHTWQLTQQDVLMCCVPVWIGRVCVNSPLSVGQSCQLLKWQIQQRGALNQPVICVPGCCCWGWSEPRADSIKLKVCFFLGSLTVWWSQVKASDHVLNQRTLRCSLIAGLIFGACAIDQFVAGVWQQFVKFYYMFVLTC